jgi:hypothetical protein
MLLSGMAKASDKKRKCKRKETLPRIRLQTFIFYTDSKNIFLELF